MNSNYKVVEVYLSYGENSISKIDIIKSEFGVDDVVKGVYRELDIKEFKDDDDLYYGIYSIDEKKDIGVIGYGDESVLFVIKDSSKWYNKVDEFNLDRRWTKTNRTKYRVQKRRKTCTLAKLDGY